MIRTDALEQLNKAWPRSSSATRPASSSYLRLGKYSFGLGDRFAHQARPQLRACMMAWQRGAEIIPVWNKSNREHTTVGSNPDTVRVAAEKAVLELGWTKPFHIDADHINLGTVDGFLRSSDFYTLDVASEIGKPPPQSQVDDFIAKHPELIERIPLPRGERAVELSRDALAQIASKYLSPTRQAGRIYRHIESALAKRKFVTEVSMDETDTPQSPAELLVILAALSDEGIPLQTIAPKFTGRFNKGVDYVGDLSQFEAEFRSDLAVIEHAIQNYGLPPELKLSIHSGSDKFSIYPAIRRALRDTGAGVHVKTAGTTWLEELIGLSEAGGDGLQLAKEIYAEAYLHRDELCSPYAAVIDIDVRRLPSPQQVKAWSSEQYTKVLRHNPKCPDYNPNVRQLLHVGYKIAARLGQRYLDMLVACQESISSNVTANLYERHLVPIFLA